jgi:hypothetical protein
MGNELLKFLSKIDFDQISRRFPDEKWKEKFDRAKNDFKFVIEQADVKARCTPQFVKSIEEASLRMREIYTYLNENTEISSKARLNEVVMWGLSDYSERAIYLAGAAREKKVRQPYRTQIQNLPSHACLARYRQIRKITEYLTGELEGAVQVDIMDILKQMSFSLLAQFDYFSTEAYQENQVHPQCAYHKALALLLLGFAMDGSGRTAEAQASYKRAESIIWAIEEPKSGMHYMYKQYINRAYLEFKTFKHLCKRHKRIADRLEFLNSKACALSEEDLLMPQQYYNIGTYVQVGRAASVATLVYLSAAAFDLNTAAVGHAIGSLWHQTTDHVLGSPTIEPVKTGPNERVGENTLGTADQTPPLAETILADTGGLSRHARRDTGGLATHQTARATAAETILADTGGLSRHARRDTGGLAATQTLLSSAQQDSVAADILMLA